MGHCSYVQPCLAGVRVTAGVCVCRSHVCLCGRRNSGVVWRLCMCMLLMHHGSAAWQHALALASTLRAVAAIVDDVQC